MPSPANFTNTLDRSTLDKGADYLGLDDTSVLPDGETKKILPIELVAGAGGILDDGTVPMAAALDMGGFAITNVGTVDGRDVSADGAALDAHLVDVANPHSVSLQQVVDDQAGVTVTGAPSIEPDASKSLGSTGSPWLAVHADVISVTDDGSASLCAVRSAADIDTGLFWVSASEQVFLSSSGGEASVGGGATVRVGPGEVRLAINGGHSASLLSSGFNIGTTLKPDTNGSRDLGLTGVRWRDAFIQQVHTDGGTASAPGVEVGTAGTGVSENGGVVLSHSTTEVARFLAGTRFDVHLGQPGQIGNFGARITLNAGDGVAAKEVRLDATTTAELAVSTESVERFRIAADHVGIGTPGDVTVHDAPELRLLAGDGANVKTSLLRAMSDGALRVAPDSTETLILTTALTQIGTPTQIDVTGVANVPSLRVGGGTGPGLFSASGAMAVSVGDVERVRVQTDGLHVGVPASIADAQGTLWLNSGDGAAARQGSIFVRKTDGAQRYQATEHHFLDSTGTLRMLVNNSVIQASVTLRPPSARGSDLGAAGVPWGDIYHGHDIVQTSAETETTDATNQIIGNTVVSDEGLYLVRTLTIATDQAATPLQGGMWGQVLCLRRDAGGAASQIGTTQNLFPAQTDGGGTAALQISGNGFRTLINGVAATTIKWRQWITVIKVPSA